LSYETCCDDVGSRHVRTLVIGSGGREHALVSALSRDPDVSEVHAAPGNPGMTSATLHDVDPLDPSRVADLAADLEVDLVVVGPEAPLVLGVADAVRETGIACFGPSREAARIEGSKAFAKQVMAAAGVPTALAHVCETAAEVATALDAFGPPYVVKDDGLAAGKGVVVTGDRSAAVAHAAGCDRVLVEEYLDGPEISLFAVTDGVTVVPMQPAQDFKRVGDGDTGPNTGGMGAYTPLPWAPDGLVEEVVDRVLQPTVDEMRRRGHPFQGLLYAGLAVTSRGIRVVEFNARFGDPETQALLARLRTPLGNLLHAAATGRLAEHARLTWREGAAVAVVVAAKGYPESPRKGDLVEGLDAAADLPGVVVMHAGTALDADGRLRTTGGRILAVTAVGADLEEARSRAYSGVAAIRIDGSHHRSDIALQPLADSILSS
jgi:phosphoribosylamine--glycine ligase